jgi:predicted dehydrogenase
MSLNEEKTDVAVENADKGNESRIITRRQFVSGAAAVTAGVMGMPLILRAQGANKKLNIAFVGTGGRAGAHVNANEFKEHNYVAFADVDKNNWKDILKIAPNAKGYTDYRKMLDAHMKEIDVLIVATPDHTHALPSLHAIREGKHVYCEKPLTWSIQESRLMEQFTAAKKVATQMGNQGHANSGNRRVVEWVRAGVIGDITEVHTWTNRPVWDSQGIIERPPTKPVPENLDWDSWIGPAPYRDYHEKLHTFAWRGWQEFGCGAVGDMGCHSWDCVFWALQPDYPSQVELLRIEGPGGKETFPRKTHFKWHFPAKGNRKPFVAHWYSGGFKPPVPEEFINDPVRKNGDKLPELPGSGNIFIGTKGKFIVTGDYADSGPRMMPDALNKEIQRPEQTIPPSPGHYREFLMAATGEKPWDYPGSNFAGYAAPLTDVMLIGAIAEKIGEVGFKIDCNPEKREIVTPLAQTYWGREYRKGWELPKL